MYNIIQKNRSLSHLNTLRLKSTVVDYVEFSDINLLPKISTYIKEHKCNFFVLGGGSNILLPEIYDGLVIHCKLEGITCVAHDDTSVLVRAMAGEKWDGFVEYTTTHGFFGLENLSLIPGTVGAAPIQNIGAYGVEVCDFIEYVEVYDILEERFKVINNKDCGFKYRHSIFKTLPNLIVTAVVFRLLKEPFLNLAYVDVAKCMSGMEKPTPLDLRNCVIQIRQAKLPDPEIIPNVGSFFHNPILANDKVDELKHKYINLPVFRVDDNYSKVSAGWLIDNLGLKGYREDKVGTYVKQALVLVNYTDATQLDILNFAEMIKNKIKSVYDIDLNIEPIIIQKG